MPRVCTICSHKQRSVIERSLVAGESVRGLAKQYKISHQSLQRHSSSCVSKALTKASETREVSIAGQLLQEVESLHKTTLDLLLKATKQDDIRTALAGIREARGNLELLARMTGKLQPKEVTEGAGLVTWEEYLVLFRHRHGISKA